VVITFYTKVSMMSIFFCVALDIIIYPAALTLLGATPQTPFSKIVNKGTGVPATRLGATPQPPYRDI